MVKKSCSSYKKSQEKKYFFIYSSAFLRGLLPCVRTNDLAYVSHTSEGARTVRYLGPIYLDLWDHFATVELHLLSIICRCLLISHLVLNVEHYILCEQVFPFHPQKFRSFIGSRTRVLSFRSSMFFHCASRPRRKIFYLSQIFGWIRPFWTWPNKGEIKWPWKLNENQELNCILVLSTKFNIVVQTEKN